MATDVKTVYGPVKPETEGDRGEGAPRKRKVKNRILHLTELIPDATFQLVAQYGASEEPMYVMSIEVNGQEFQGIGPSKKRAKAMCADYALVYLGAIDKVDETPADMIDYKERSDDFTADVIDQTTQLFYDFSLPESDQPVDPVPENFYADDDDDDDFMNEIDDMTLQLLGKNPLTIMGELRPDAIYTLLDETGDPLHPKFLMSVTLDEETFQGSGPSKKLAKGRAARDALLKFYNLEFGASENGMPIYEGDARIWQHFKAKHEAKAQERLDLSRDPVVVLQEYFPQIRYSFRDPVERDKVIHYTTVVNIFDEVYEGVGTSKKDSKCAAAANTLEALRRNGVLAAKEREVDADRKAAVNLPRIPSLLECDKKNVLTQRNAIAKLNLLYPNLEYELLAEKPVRNTLLTAFVMSVTVEGRSFAGVGKTKKAAKVEAAEKSLRYLKMWTKEDEVAKEQSLAEDVDPVTSISRHREFQEAKRARQMHESWFGGPPGGPWGPPDMGWRPDMGEWNENPMAWNDGPGGGWGGPHWDNRGGNPSGHMGGGNFNDTPDMRRGFGGDFGMRRPFGGRGRGMGRGFDAGFGGNADPRGGPFYPEEGVQGDGQHFQNPGFGGNRGGYSPSDIPGGPGRGGPRMPFSGAGGAPPKRFPNSGSFDGSSGGGFQGNPLQQSSQPVNMWQPGPDVAGPGGFRPPLDTTGGFRQGNPRTPSQSRTPTKPGSTTSNVSTSNLFPQKAVPTFQPGTSVNNYQYGIPGSTTAFKDTQASSGYQPSLGTGRMYGQSEGYQSGGAGTMLFQQTPNIQPGTSLNYQAPSYQDTTTNSSSVYSGSTYPTSSGTAFNDPNFMAAGGTYAAGYYGNYAQGYGYDYMAGYTVPAGTTDPNYGMSAYASQGSVNPAYYPGYDYSQTAASTGTMDSYSSGGGTGVMKNTW